MEQEKMTENSIEIPERRFSLKKMALPISAALSFLVFLALWVITNHMSDALDSQSMAERWSAEGDAAQISCFFSDYAGITQDSILEWEYNLDTQLQEASITVTSENASARLWADAWSTTGQITVTSDRTSITADAVGIGGDFFLFHPLKLLYGSYFSGNDDNQDYVIIDEDAAWQLFGSNNVAGQLVEINGTPHMITGVIERESGYMAESAGLDSTVIYVSFSTLTGGDESAAISHYEIVMPNPVSGYALGLVQDQFGGGDDADNPEAEILENTSRYGLLNRLKVIAAFGTRSMNNKAILYPYWENMARGYEDIIAALTLLMLICLLYPTIYLLVLFIRWWRHKGWTIRDIAYKLKDKAERAAEQRREQKLLAPELRDPFEDE